MRLGNSERGRVSFGPEAWVMSTELGTEFSRHLRAFSLSVAELRRWKAVQVIST